MTKKDMMIAILTTFCLTATLFTITPTNSSVNPYDPWYDLNDDGVIDIADVVMLTSRYRAAGTPINKTDLLLELQERVNILEEKLRHLSCTWTTKIVDESSKPERYSITDFEIDCTVSDFPSSVNFTVTNTWGYFDIDRLSYSLEIHRYGILKQIVADHMDEENIAIGESRYLSHYFVCNMFGDLEMRLTVWVCTG